jgi:hypothetical protein
MADRTDLESIASQIEALSPPDRLILAAGLLQQGRAEIAHTIVEQVALELGAALAMQRIRKGPSR